MKNTVHPYIRYAQALILVENKLTDCDEITADIIKYEIDTGLDAFRVKPLNIFEGKTGVTYGFCKEEKGNTGVGIFLAPNIIATDKSANNTWKATNDLILELQNESLNKNNDLTMSVAPTAGEYLSFSIGGGIGRGKPKSTLLEQSLSIVTTLTKNKPCLQYRIDKKGMPEMFNVCVIPDLPIDELKDFISVFKRMCGQKAASDLMIGNVVSKETGKGDSKKITYSPKRPMIFKGNFPNPPRSSVLGSIALLGAIGEFAKEEEASDMAKKVLESLKDTEIYLIKYGGAKVFKYNHHIIDLAKEGKMKTIVDSLYYSRLYNQDRRSSTNTEYQKFDLFTSRFLQLFNYSAFKDFLAFRAEYPNEVTTLFNTYFTKMEKIDSEIVRSARTLGKWLNRIAYLAAKSEIKEGTPNYWEELRKMKSKALVELESSTFSAKSGSALLAQAIIRAGRLSGGMDAPEGAALFMEKTASGELPLDDAKNLLIAFSRLVNKSEKTEKNEAGVQTETEDEEDFSDD
jgi:CRISPR-associated protein Cas8c/Csp2